MCCLDAASLVGCPRPLHSSSPTGRPSSSILLTSWYTHFEVTGTYPLSTMKRIMAALSLEYLFVRLILICDRASRFVYLTPSLGTLNVIRPKHNFFSSIHEHSCSGLYHLGRSSCNSHKCNTFNSSFKREADPALSFRTFPSSLLDSGGYLFFPYCLPSLKRMNETDCASWCDEEVVMVGVVTPSCSGAEAMAYGYGALRGRCNEAPRA
jgi:hypothetical protein